MGWLGFFFHFGETCDTFFAVQTRDECVPAGAPPVDHPALCPTGKENDRRQDARQRVPILERQMPLAEILSAFGTTPSIGETPPSFFFKFAANRDFDSAHFCLRSAFTSDQKSSAVFFAIMANDPYGIKYHQVSRLLRLRSTVRETG